ncbi:MAG: hypothetical protein V2J07_04880, partial [Anaerolineae bacterium]|nr:hypothetical protein [Anaerolineae bacterium]
MLYNVTLELPTHIANGLLNGSYERVGGVIRTADTKRTVTWLRDAFGSNDSVLSSIASPVGNIGGMLTPFGAVASILNLAVTTMGFALVM